MQNFTPPPPPPPLPPSSFSQGTHLRSIAEIQALKIIACEKDRGATRLRFISGHRLLQHVTSSMLRDRELNVLLNCGPDAFASNVTSLQLSRY
jgi:alanyl-tRNA synthetase